MSALITLIGVYKHRYGNLTTTISIAPEAIAALVDNSGTEPNVKIILLSGVEIDVAMKESDLRHEINSSRPPT